VTDPWLQIRVDGAALTRNMQMFRARVAEPTKLMAVVKANAYGHGLLHSARAFLAGGADVLGVHTVAEAADLRAGGLDTDILVLGPVNPSEAGLASELAVDITVGSTAAVEWAAAAPGDLRIHLKVETGVNRQGLVEAELAAVLDRLKDLPHLKLAGLSSHFADIEDTTNHAYARAQMERFQGYGAQLAAAGYTSATAHMTCSAATLLWTRTHADMARVGISAYGVWPSRETLVSLGQTERPALDLSPAMTWAVRVSQVREVAAGETVGYGRTWKAMTDSRIAVLPVGYSDGLPRALADRAHVLIHGKRAPFRGRMCMNLCMVDVTHIPEVQPLDEAVLLGRQGDEEISAELLAGFLDTIAYEVLTLPGVTWHRTLTE